MVRTGLGGGIPGAPDDGGSSDPSTDDPDPVDGGTAGGGRGPRFDDDPTPDPPDPDPPDDPGDGLGGSVPGAPDDDTGRDPSTPAPEPDPPIDGGTAGGGRGPRFDDDPTPDPPDPDPPSGGGGGGGGSGGGGSGSGGSGGFVDRVTSTVDSVVDRATGTQPDSDITDRLTTGGLLSERPGTSDGVLPGTVGGVDVSEQRVQQAAAETRQARNQRFDSNEELTVGGSDLPDRVITGAARTASAATNPAGLVSSAETAVEVGTSAPGAIADEGAGDVAETAGAVAVDAAGNTVDAAQQRPAEFAGGAIFGAAAGTAASRSLSGLRRGGSSPDADGGGLGDLSSAVDVERVSGGDRSFLGDTRGQASFGRTTRGDSDTIDGETIEVERTVERGDDVETVNAETFVDDRVRGGSDDLAAQFRAAADEAETIEQRQLTPRQRAEDRVPSASEFESPAAQQREINRLADRFRQDAMGDLDNRVVPQGPSATTRGQFGLTDTPDAGSAGAGITGTAIGTPGAGGVGAEGTDLIGGDPTALGVTPTAGTLGELGNGRSGGGQLPDDATGGGTTTGGGETTTTGGGSLTTGGADGTQLGGSVAETISTTTGTVTGTATADAAPTTTGATLDSAATATTTAVETSTTAVSAGLGADTGGRRTLRSDLEEEQDDDDRNPLAFATDADEFGSGLLSGSEAADQFLGR